MRLSNRFTKYFFLLGLLLSGCSSSYQSADYLTSVTQTPPQPVYNRVFLARPPEVLPSNKASKTKAPKVVPVFQLDVSNETIDSVIKTLSSAARYRGYTASMVADKKISVEALGTIDELADIISKKADIHVSVDHANHEIRAIRARH